MSDKFNIGNRIKSFKYAFNGIGHALLTQHNFQIHSILALVAIALGFWLHISTLEWVAIIIVIGAVLAAEIINTAIEELVNLISPQKNIKAGIIKDLAAGAVLVAAIAAFITGMVIFLPKIIDVL